jgi:biotin synthase
MVLKQAGVERVGVGLDCATPETFEQIKPGYRWRRYLHFIHDIVDIFGIGSVHLIVGLGDTDQAIIKLIQEFRDINAYVALFAFTPVRGTDLTFPPPSIGRYRALQLARYLIVYQISTYDEMCFQDGALTSFGIPQSRLEQVLALGEPFRTSGCPDCNRPFYNERPGGVMYNYPWPLSLEEKKQAASELEHYLCQEFTVLGGG